jgi:hypothetical protein
MSPLGTSATEWPIVPAPGDYDDGELDGIKIGDAGLKSKINQNCKLLEYADDVAVY